ncbi:MAG: bifunctional DNA primase/polymerase, partial [Chloroflexota bacterium]|nr:bifunctional DNA primase/polymerase [Chloroflexota bacterium]
MPGADGGSGGSTMPMQTVYTGHSLARPPVALGDHPHDAEGVAATPWPAAVRRAIAQRDVTTAGIELLAMNAGLSLVPTDDKEPIQHFADRIGERAGRRPETDDPQTWQQWCAVWPDLGMGIVPGDRFLVLDDDRGDLNPHTYGLKGTYADQTRRGRHHWARLAQGTLARSTRLPGGGGDILTGSRYVVSSPTQPYIPIDIDAPILTLPDDSSLWELLRPQRPAHLATIPRLTAWHRTQAGHVIANLMHAPPDIARDASSLLAGQVPEDASPSEADYRLALMVTFHTTEPGIIAAVLWSSGLSRKKWSRPDYLPRQISAALSRRRELASARPNPSSVSYGTPPFLAGKELSVNDQIVRIVASQNRDIDGGFARVPVQALATTCGVSRKTVQRAIDRLERDGHIETVVMNQYR